MGAVVINDSQATIQTIHNDVTDLADSAKERVGKKKTQSEDNHIEG